MAALTQDLLWVDSEMQAGDAGVRLLTSEGFQVDCAVTGAAGWAMARARCYVAIIIDLHLPDVSGLTLLEHLRKEGLSTPVIVLTGFGDVESAVAAMKLGVADYRCKPLPGDELATVVRASIEGAREPARRQPFPGAPILASRSQLQDAEWILLNRLESFSNFRTNGQSENGQSENGQTDHTLPADLILRDVKPRLTGWLLQAVVDRAIPLRSFFTRADMLRYVLTADETTAYARAFAHIREIVIRGAAGAGMETVESVPRLVHTALAMLETSLTRHVRLKERELADRLALDPAHLGRLLRVKTGLTFRQWRCGLAMKAAVHHLTTADLQIAQIAFDVGFAHPGQFDREFRQLFGVSPRQFRRLWFLRNDFDTGL